MSRRGPLVLPSTLGPSGDDAEDQELTDDQAQQDGQGHGGGDVIAGLVGTDLTTPVTVEQVPAPYAARDAEELDDSERADLAVCERAVSGLQKAFMVAGKALATINQARLYRAEYSSFETYLEERWGMKSSQAYRLMEAWPVAVALSPIGEGLTESQTRELVPVGKKHGVGAARAVYEAVAEQGGRMTAARLAEAVKVLPPRLASPEQAGDVVRVAAAEGRLTVAAKIPRPAPVEQVLEQDQDQEQDQADVAEAAPDERKDAAEHAAAVELGRNIRLTAGFLEQAEHHWREALAQRKGGVVPVDHGAAVADRSRIRRVLAALDAEALEL